jgi:septal ring factor EnvC (AmiA/AmiB activator)
LTGETPVEPSAPATKDDLRSLRRWLIVAGVWAAAATAIAVIALVQANKDDDTEKLGEQTASQIGQVQKELNQRLDEIESRLGDLAPAEDVTRLDNRLKKVEDSASKTTERLDTMADDVDDLQRRVEELESSAGTDTTGTDTTETTP